MTPDDALAQAAALVRRAAHQLKSEADARLLSGLLDARISRSIRVYQRAAVLDHLADQLAAAIQEDALADPTLPLRPLPRLDPPDAPDLGGAA